MSPDLVLALMLHQFDVLDNRQVPMDSEPQQLGGLGCTQSRRQIPPSPGRDRGLNQFITHGFLARQTISVVRVPRFEKRQIAGGERRFAPIALSIS